MKLTLLKWRDDNGHKQTLRLTHSVSPEWRKLGDLIGLLDSQQQALSSETSRQYTTVLSRCVHSLDEEPTSELSSDLGGTI